MNASTRASYPTGYPNVNNYPPHAHQPSAGYPYGYPAGPSYSTGYPNVNYYPPPHTYQLPPAYGPRGPVPVWDFQTRNNKNVKGTQEGISKLPTTLLDRFYHKLIRTQLEELSTPRIFRYPDLCE